MADGDIDFQTLYGLLLNNFGTPNYTSGDLFLLICFFSASSTSRNIEKSETQLPTCALNAKISHAFRPGRFSPRRLPYLAFCSAAYFKFRIDSFSFLETALWSHRGEHADDLPLREQLPTLERHVADLADGKLPDDHKEELLTKFLPKFVTLIFRKIERFASFLLPAHIRLFHLLIAFTSSFSSQILDCRRRINWCLAPA